MNRRSCTPVAALLALVVALLACGNPAPEWQLRGWTVTPSPFSTSTPIIVEVEKTVVVQITSSPAPTLTVQPTEEVRLCVNADETVYLRPSAGVNGYPILPLENGTIVLDLGGRDGEWVFVAVGDKRGWINKAYIEDC